MAEKDLANLRLNPCTASLSARPPTDSGFEGVTLWMLLGTRRVASPYYLVGFVISALLWTASAHPDDSHPTNGSIPINSTLYRDPYLDYQPIYADSLPVQVLLTGICLALNVVLLVHLVFTFKYHWPLARLNYALQFTGVIVLLISMVTTSIVILTFTQQKSRIWPYMFDYIAVEIPLATWSQGQLVMWYMLKATVSGVVNVCCIFCGYIRYR